MLYIVLLFLVQVCQATVFVECPTTANFVACQACIQVSSLSPITCSCDYVLFSIAGRCFTPLYPCKQSLINPLYNQTYTEFNIWNGIVGPFWSSWLNQAMNTTTPPNPTPDFLNNYNFTNMTNAQMRGWTQAYFLYMIFKSEISSFSRSDQNVYLFQAISLAQSMLGKSSFQKWAQIQAFMNQKLNKNVTEDDFYFLIIRPRAKALAPCQLCELMYGPVMTTNQLICSKCSPNCYSCRANASICTKCFQGFYLSSVDNTCGLCAVGQCQNCSETGQCFNCFDQLTYSNNTCLECNQPCVTCRDGNPNTCTSCSFIYNSYTPDSFGQCLVCAQQQCYECKPPSNCSQCFDGYYSQNGTCYPCSDNCRTCASSSSCLMCFFGYGIINGSCALCKAPGCALCDYDTSICSICISPYFTFNLTSIKCILTSTTTIANRFLYETIKCRPGCDYCYNNDTTKCFQCHERYFMQNRMCKKCMPGCLSCFNYTNCNLCVTGYTLAGTACVRCPQDCSKCSPTNPSVCLDCRIALTLSANNQCVSTNKPLCLVYEDTDNTRCVECLLGYALNSDNQCIQCVSGCNWGCNPKNISECKKDRFEIGQWFLYGYSFGDQGCLADINNNCVSPQDGFQLTQVGDKFTVVRQCLYPCATCNLTDCFSCKDGYTFNAGLCTPNVSCNPNCPVCVAGTQRNYGTNQCVACSLQNCAACSGNDCLECYDGFYYSSGICKPCPAKCKKCYDGENCNVCASGYLWPAQYKIYSYDCVKCSDNCQTCKFESNLCTQCRPGMRLSNFRCINQYNVAFYYLLDYNYTQFMTAGKSEDLIKAIQTITGAAYTDVFLMKIKEGSTSVDGIISTANSSVASQTYNAMVKGSLPGFVVLKSSFSNMNDTSVVTCSSTGGADCPVASQDSSISKGAIIGIAVGCAILGIAIIGTIIYCLKKRKTDDPYPIQTRSESAEFQSAKGTDKDMNDVRVSQKYTGFSSNQKFKSDY